MIDWNAAKAKTLAMTSAVFDKTLCRMKPMVAAAGGRDLNAAPGMDASRAEFDFPALLDLEPSQDSIPRHLTSDPGTDGKMVAYDACVTALTTGWAYLPKRGDLVEIVESEMPALVGKIFKIAVDRRDGSPRMAFYGNWVN